MHELVQVLVNNRKLDSQDKITVFLEALRQIETERKPELLPELLKVFDDGTTHFPPMQALQTYVESFELDVWLVHLLKNTREMLGQARRWTIEFYAHILNSDEDRQRLKSLYRDVDEENKLLMREVLESIYTEGHLDRNSRKEIYTKVQDVLE